MRLTGSIRWRRDEAMGEERRCVRCGREDVDENQFDCNGGRGVSTFHRAGCDCRVPHYRLGQTNKI
jgi:hypothetical protein